MSSKENTTPHQGATAASPGEKLKYTNENSLTAPWDKSGEQRPSTMNHPPLSEEEFESALAELNIKDFTTKFRKVERRFCDHPPVSLQNFGLISFVPTRGSRPDARGVYGFVKLRGNFATEREADERAEDLIRNHDSYHKIQHVFVGRPFPLTINEKYIKNVNEIDLQKVVAAEVSANVKSKREKERRDIEDIKERSERLQEDTDKEAIDTGEIYSQLQTKKAQLMWTYLETEKKMEEMKEGIIKTRAEIAEYDQDPHFKEVFMEKILKARKKAGIIDTEEQLKNSFMVFMVEDREPDLPF